MSSAASRGRVFQLSFNPLSEKSEWIIIEDDDEEDGEKISTPKALLASTSYLDMLNDTRRNRAFRSAIEKTIAKPCHVLDIGAGTGLLSMMAARAMDIANITGTFASKGKVTACESYLPMVKLMRRVIRANNMEGKIKVLNKRSDELEVGKDIPSRADALVTEILDSELLGEGLIPTLQHAHDMLLVENPLTVPYRATIFGQLVESTYLLEKHNLINREAKISDGIHLAPGANVLCGKQKHFSMHCNSIKKEIKLLSEPFKVFDFDFWKRPDSSRETELCINISKDGTVHAIISWWLLQLDKEGTIFYSTGPEWVLCPFDEKELVPLNLDSRNWCDHWTQCVWLAPTTNVSVLKDEEIKLRASHDETSVSYEFMVSPQIQDVGCYGINTLESQVCLFPERNAIYGDSSWRCLMLSAIRRALQNRVFSLCLVPDDSIFLTVAVAQLAKNSCVISLFPGLGKKGLLYLQTIAVANHYKMDRIEVMKKKDLPYILNEHHQKMVDLVVAEPFYYGNDFMLPWQNLLFWKDRTLLDPFLSKDVHIMPCKGFLKACAMYLPDLWQSRRCLTDIEGFDHSMVNSILGACGDLPMTEDIPFLPFFVWQCGEIKILSEIVTLLEFDFSKSMSPCSGSSQVRFKEAGVCHGFVVWMDWMMNAKDTSSILSTGPDKRHWKQAVKLLSKPVNVRYDNLLSVELQTSFNPIDGEFTIHHTFF